MTRSRVILGLLTTALLFAQACTAPQRRTGQALEERERQEQARRLAVYPSLRVTNPNAAATIRRDPLAVDVAKMPDSTPFTRLLPVGPSRLEPDDLQPRYNQVRGPGPPLIRLACRLIDGAIWGRVAIADLSVGPAVATQEERHRNSFGRAGSDLMGDRPIHDGIRRRMPIAVLAKGPDVTAQEDRHRQSFAQIGTDSVSYRSIDDGIWRDLEAPLLASILALAENDGPNTPADILRQLAWVLRAAAFTDEAQQAFALMAQRTPGRTTMDRIVALAEVVGDTDLPQVVFHTAYHLYREGQYAHAHQYADQYLRNHTEHIDRMLILKALCYGNQNESEKGLAALQKVQADYPESPSVLKARFLTAWIHMNDQQTEKATEVLRALVQEFPHSEEAQKARNVLKKLAPDGDR